MGFQATLIIIGIYLLISLILLPFQYSYIKELKSMHKKNEEKGLNQNDTYEKMSFEEQQLHLNAQGNFLFFGANLLASILYKLKQKK
ncbi:DUF3949 domain-containing protein [Cytobacillus sp. FJAT-54145]|uniref:DUF3949 domain-containing protein n=1 Tax=Cytobacillus spartinae TaxID=3299023 RepID=A0ABW6K7C5_9BACI